MLENPPIANLRSVSRNLSMDLNKTICDIKESYYNQRRKVFGVTYYETQEYPFPSHKIFDRETYKIETSKKRLIYALILDMILLGMFIVSIPLMFEEGHLIEKLVLLVLCIILPIRGILNHTKFYLNPTIELIVTKKNLNVNQIGDIAWENVLTIHFNINISKYTFYKLILHYLDENAIVQKKTIDIKYLNYTPEDICSILSKYYLYENVYR